MGLHNPVINEGYVPAYQMSAVPFVTSSVIQTGEIIEIIFPQVTRFFNIQNLGTNSTDEIAIAFTLNGLKTANSNFISLGKSASLKEEIRTDRLFVSCSYGSSIKFQLIAGLTNISSAQFQTITGSSGYSGVG
jgi:hypothetical protein